MYNNYSSHFNSNYAAFGSLYGRMDEHAAVGLLQHLTKEDLQLLLDGDDKLNGLIQDLQQVRSVQCDHDDLVARNKSLAEYNLSFQPKLDSLKTEVAVLYDTVNKLKEELNMDKAKLDTYGGNQKLDGVHAVLQTMAAESEEQAEELASDFCDKKMAVDEFLSRYIPCRVLGHKRRVKVEKMGELLRDSAAPWSTAPAASSGVDPFAASRVGPGPPPAAPAPYPAPAHVPYPAPYPSGSGFGMPMPNLYRPNF